MDPVWVDDTVYFISDRDGVANVWSYQTKTKKLTQVTKFTDFDVKTLDSSRTPSCSSRPLCSRLDPEPAENTRQITSER